MKQSVKGIICLLLVCFFAAGCGNLGSKTQKSQEQPQAEAAKPADEEEDSHITMVKNGCPSNYPDSPYGQVFEKFFENGSWGYFEAKNQDGNMVDIVEFVGDCEFEKADYKAQIQFTVDVDNNTFDATYLALDGEAQTLTKLQQLLAAAYAKEGPAVSGQVGVPAADTQATTAQATTSQATTAAPSVIVVPSGGGYSPKAIDNYYILPYSSSYRLTKSDISHLTKSQLRLARNEIYARHGRMFNDDSLQDYFNGQAWYTPIYTPDEFKESWLSDVEVDNIAFIKSYE